MVVETAEPAIGNTAGDGVRHGACGILGGADGLPHRYTLYSDNRPPRAIKTKEVGLVIHPNDVLVLESGGGGGWDNPAERDPAAVAEDLENEFVSVDNSTLTHQAPTPPLPRERGRGGVGAWSPLSRNAGEELGAEPAVAPLPHCGRGC